MKAYRFLKNHGWCLGSYARDAEGNSVRPSMQACSFCAAGVLFVVYGTDGFGVTDELFKAEKSLYRVLDRRKFEGAISGFNDTPGRTKEEVLELFKEAGV